MSQQYYRTIHSIISTGHWITDQVGRSLKSYGISEPQYNVLRTLDNAKGGPITVQEILDAMVQASSNITRIIDKLILKGFVDRRECPTNRRKMDISLTKSGKVQLKKLDAIVYEFHKPFQENLTEKELATLEKLITKLKKQSND